MDIVAGTALGDRYELSSRIAVGGMGEVWEATDRVIGRTVAVKILKPELMAQPGFMDRFRMEGRLAALVDDDGIARVYDYGEDQSTAFLVMELIRGEPLSAILRRHRRLEPDRVLDIVAQTGDALDSAHAAGLVHRDIKPDNILITADNRVKVADFGIARLTGQAPFTVAGQVMGTVQYISPEQVSGRPVTAASDIYSLGVVAYEALAGRLPFGGESSVAVAHSQVHDTPPALPPDVPQRISDLVLSCMAKDAARRPSSGAELAHAARALHTGRSAREDAAIPAGPSVSGRGPAPSVLRSRPLLETKLYRPRVRRQTVERPRLMSQLDRCIESSLTIVSAPAGFGKSTLLGAWAADRAGGDDGGRAVAWLSLDVGDNDPASFWRYTVTALRTVAPGVGSEALALIEGAGFPSPAAGLTGLLNDLSNLQQDIILVIDDYHLIDAREVHDGVSFLIDNMPPNIHLVIAGRADPPLPLARLRARGELIEVRAADLRFRTDEAAEYLTSAMGLPLSAPEVSTLDDRTEGWIAALQLAALSMRGRDDLADFVAGFAGDDRYIVDYLAEEVLQNQPTEVRSFLLQTSILTRMNAALADAVSGRPDGQAMLEALDRANLFLIPLDERRRWFRYHHLFAEVLQARLADERPNDVPDLHRRASAWYAEHDELDAAIHHALTAPDPDLAGRLIETSLPAMARDRREAALRDWMEALPPEIFRARPVLSLGYAGSLLSTGEVTGVEERLRDAERWSDTTADAAESAGPLVVDADEFRRLPGSIAIYRSGLALAQGDLTATVGHARRALSLLDTSDDYRRGAAAALEGLALWATGDLDGAYEGYARSVSSFRRSGHIADVLGCTVTLADIRVTQGRLSDALSSYEEALQLARAQTSEVRRGIPDMHVGIATILCERGQLDAAGSQLESALALGDAAGLPKYRYRSRLAMAQLRQARGDLAGAVELVEEADRFFVTDMSPLVRPVPATRARLWLHQGRTGDALAWARDAGVSTDDDLSYLREYEHVTLGRALLVQHRRTGDEQSLRDALDLLARLRETAAAGGRTGTVIEILALQALAHRALGDVERGVASLQHALQLAEEEGYARVFLDEGAPMGPLLAAVAAGSVAREYAARLLAMLRGDDVTETPDESGVGLAEPLSDREREVLRLLSTEMSGPEIARLLVVSLNTVRTHTKRIYTKLGINNRRSAVLRAQELGELPGPRHRSS
ncbi:serine/threonine-protein kinase [uncultured Microbacterium sp.]|uniref:non-specific serine/threonine protein kinase n=1 Tax=uncultured Microbacterium sp. TaxID=191216 RepID=A0A1Y5P6L4_9MICO|nr:ATP-dependent transcriptional regulator, MalT-like, LuxR family (modular protein) [uncultured Microbacterium sp.]